MRIKRIHRREKPSLYKRALRAIVYRQQLRLAHYRALERQGIVLRPRQKALLEQADKQSAIDRLQQGGNDAE